MGKIWQDLEITGKMEKKGITILDLEMTVDNIKWTGAPLPLLTALLHWWSVTKQTRCVCGEGWVRGGGWSNHLISKLARSVLVAASCSCVPPSACCTIIASSASTFGQPGHTGHTGYWGRGEEPWRWSLSCKPRHHQTTDCYPQIEMAIVCCYSEQRKQQTYATSV